MGEEREKRIATPLAYQGAVREEGPTAPLRGPDSLPRSNAVGLLVKEDIVILVPECFENSSSLGGATQPVNIQDCPTKAKGVPVTPRGRSSPGHREEDREIKQITRDRQGGIKITGLPVSIRRVRGQGERDPTYVNKKNLYGRSVQDLDL